MRNILCLRGGGILGYAVWLMRNYRNVFEPIGEDPIQQQQSNNNNNEDSSNNNNTASASAASGGGGGGNNSSNNNNNNDNQKKEEGESDGQQQQQQQQQQEEQQKPQQKRRSNYHDKQQHRRYDHDFDTLLLDCNGLIHPCCHDTAPKPEPETEEEMFERIFVAIDDLVKLAKPKKVLLIAIDGVAPRSKMNQQRARRFRAATERLENAEIANEMADAVKSVHSLEAPPTKERWDHSAITPSTAFMERLDQLLEWYILKRLNSGDPLWRDLTVILSDAHVPGEGEHKLMHYVRSLRDCEEYDPYTKHCIVGMDADLICLALATHEINFYVLRNRLDDETKQPISNKYCVLNVRKFRQRLQEDFRDLSFANFERIVDDFVFLCFFIGNDFLPHMPLVEIKQRGIETMLDHYVQNFEKGNYLTEGGEILFDRLRHFLRTFIDERYNELLDLREEKKAYTERARANVERRIDGINKELQDALAELDPEDPESRSRVAETVHKCYVTTAKEQRRFVGGMFPQNWNYGDEGYRIAYYCTKFGWDAPLTSNSDIVQEMQQKKEEDAAAAAAAEEEEEYDENYDEEDENNNNNFQQEDDDDNNNKKKKTTRKDLYERPKGMKPQKQEQQNQQGGGGGRGGEAKHTEAEVSASWDVFNQKVRVCCREYLRGMQWVLRYYTVGCPSWEWFFPYHHAPILEDVARWCFNIDVDMKLGEPLHPSLQLLSVLPRESHTLLPPEMHGDVMNPNSPLGKYYPSHIEVDFTEATFSYQGVIKLPFIDVKNLQEVAKQLGYHLQPEVSTATVFVRDGTKTHKQLRNLLGSKKTGLRMRHITPSITAHSPLAGRVGIMQANEGWPLDEEIECPDRGFAETKQTFNDVNEGEAIKKNKAQAYRFEMNIHVPYKPYLLVDDDPLPQQQQHQQHQHHNNNRHHNNNNNNNNNYNNNYNDNDNYNRNNNNNNNNNNYNYNNNNSHRHQRANNYHSNNNFNDNNNSNDNYDNNRNNNHNNQNQNQNQNRPRNAGRRHGRNEH